MVIPVEVQPRSDCGMITRVAWEDNDEYRPKVPDAGDGVGGPYSGVTRQGPLVFVVRDVAGIAGRQLNPSRASTNQFLVIDPPPFVEQSGNVHRPSRAIPRLPGLLYRKAGHATVAFAASGRQQVGWVDADPLHPGGFPWTAGNLHRATSGRPVELAVRRGKGVLFNEHHPAQETALARAEEVRKALIGVGWRLREP